MIQDLEKRVKELRETETRLEQSIKQQKKEEKTLEKRLETAELKLKKINEEANSIKDKSHIAIVKYESMIAEQKVINEDLKSSKKAIEKAEKDLDNLVKSNEKAQKALESGKLKLKEDKSELKAECERLELLRKDIETATICLKDQEKAIKARLEEASKTAEQATRVLVQSKSKADDIIAQAKKSVQNKLKDAEIKELQAKERELKTKIMLKEAEKHVEAQANLTMALEDKIKASEASKVSFDKMKDSLVIKEQELDLEQLKLQKKIKDTRVQNDLIRELKEKIKELENDKNA